MEYLWLMLVLILVITIVLSLEQLRRKTIQELNKVLYRDKNDQLYFSLLNNSRLNLIFTKNTIQLLKLDGYLIQGNNQETQNLFEMIKNNSLPKGEKIEFNQKKLSYYCQKRNSKKAKEALDELNHLLKGNKNESLKKECELIYRLYVLQDQDLKKELLSSSNRDGLTEFRLAKLSYYAGNLDEAKQFIESALNQLKGTSWHPICKECIKDLSNLELY